MAILGLTMALVRLLLSGDPPGDWINSLAFGDHTIYSAKYTEAMWLKLRRGMSVAELETALGPPLRKVWWTHGDHEDWWYSKAPPGKGRCQRAVVVRGGKIDGFFVGFKKGFERDVDND